MWILPKNIPKQRTFFRKNATSFENFSVNNIMLANVRTHFYFHKRKLMTFENGYKTAHKLSHMILRKIDQRRRLFLSYFALLN